MARALDKNMCSVHGKIRGAKMEERETEKLTHQPDAGRGFLPEPEKNCCISVPPQEDICVRHNLHTHTHIRVRSAVRKGVAVRTRLNASTRRVQARTAVRLADHACCTMGEFF